MSLKKDVEVQLPSESCIVPAETGKVGEKETRISDKQVCVFLDQGGSEVGSGRGVKCIHTTEGEKTRLMAPCLAVKYGKRTTSL